MQTTIPKVDYKIISNQVDASFNDELDKFNYAISHYGFLLLQNTPTVSYTHLRAHETV